MSDFGKIKAGDRVSLLSPDGQVIDVSVSIRSAGNKDHEGQLFIIDNAGKIFWEGDYTVVQQEDSVSVNSDTGEPVFERNWKEQITLRPDGSKKDIKAILFEREDGRTFKDELDSTKHSFTEFWKSMLLILKSVILWFPRQYPLIANFDIDNDPRASNLIGYKKPGIQEVEKIRFLRTGTSIKNVNNKDGSPPRKFGKNYVTRFGAINILVLALVAFSLIIGILR